MSDDWYRSSSWDQEARDVFEKKIGRARFQKPYYLWMKAAAIAQEHPDDAEALFDRALAADVDGFESARALNARATARAARGDIGATLDDLAHAATHERDAMPNLVTSARWDYAALVGMHRQRDRYDEALAFLGPRVPDLAFAGQVGLAFINHDLGKGDAAQAAAKKALSRATMHDDPASGLPLPPTPPFPNPIYDRLLVIAHIWDIEELGPPPPVWPER
ncbi:hypothetical protein EKN06_00405 [Croceicoccus ponticola]|uniref:Tetratricopeptide repeat protein n=1 Tax=Croceicoccus ponticola TaxID=2217664 RepID=A0A437GZE0_9SPHN|nr:hypothetical protein [Croceicoccus ponticola]RVQ68731.1 hypothetical protein EKN06_00405 [Croceicoccus ponticola]